MRKRSKQNRNFRFNSGTEIVVQFNFYPKAGGYWVAKIFKASGLSPSVATGDSRLAAIRNLREVAARAVTAKIKGEAPTLDYEWAEMAVALEKKKSKSLSWVLPLTLSVLLQGCAHSPFLKNWDWGVRPTPEMQKTSDEETEQGRIRALKVLTENYGQNWEKAIIPEEDRGLLIEHYDENGKKIGSSVVE